MPEQKELEKGIKEAIEVLKELKDHSCIDAAAEYGIYECCGEVDYKPHKPNCSRVRAIDFILNLLSAGYIKKSSLRCDEKKMWEIFAETKSCKPNTEDCTFVRCRSWASCVNLINAISERIGECVR
jgi:hypothetical protein